MKPLPLDYFQNYADDDVEDRTYQSNWRDYGFQRFEDYLKALKSRYRTQPKSVFEIGSADGSVIRELRSRGIDARGVELSSAMFQQAGLERSRIACADAFQVMKAIPDSAYDCVYETAAQYIPEKLLKRYFREIRRITKSDLVLVVHTHEDDPKPHHYQVNHKPSVFWFDLLDECGFRSMSEDAPFWFAKEQP